MGFPNIAKAGVYLLADLVGGLDHADIATPADLQQRLPFIRVGRTTGPDDGTSDFPVFDVDYFAATWDEACDGAEAVRDFLASGYHFVEWSDGSALIDSVVTAVGPRQLPWLATGVVRFTGTYRAQTRRS